MISVCIPTFNGERYILSQLLSILPQLNTDDEIIISDDGSTDRTLVLIASLKDPRIKLIQHAYKRKEKFRYMYTTRNLENALKHAKGDYIFLADQDDIWTENKVEILLGYLEKYTLVLSDCVVVDQDNGVIHSSYFELNGSRPGIVKNLLKNSYLGCCMAFRSSLLAKLMPISLFNVPHDIWIGLLAEKFGTVAFANQKLVRYRRHEQNVSPSGGVSGNSLAYKFIYRYKILTAYLKRLYQIKTKA